MDKSTCIEIEGIPATEEIYEELFNVIEDIERVIEQWVYEGLEDREAIKEIVKVMRPVAYDLRAGECKAYEST